MAEGKRLRSLRQFIQNSRLRLSILLVVGLLLIGIGLLTWVWEPSVRTYQVKCAGGVASFNRYKILEYLKRHQQEVDLEVEIVETEGTSEAIARVQSGELDLALVNGLLRFPQADNIRQVATLTVEPMHLLVKEEFAEKVSQDFAELGALSINVGPEGSETSLLAGAVIKFLKLERVHPEGLRLVRLRFGGLLDLLRQLEESDAAKTQEQRAKLPDAMFFSSTLPSPFVERMVRVAKYDLVPLPFTEAFAQISVEEEDFDRDHVDQIHAETAEIPAFTYGGTNPVPQTNSSTFGCPLIVIAHKDLPDEVVRRLLDRIFSGAVNRLYQPPHLSQVAPTYAFHPSSITYRDKDKPLVRADIANLIQQLLSVLGPLLGGCFALYSFYRWRQVLRFLERFRELQRLDLAAKGMLDLEDLPTESEARVAALEARLSDLQSQVVDDFCKNYFYGDGVLENFLSVMQETRGYLRHTQRTSTDSAARPDQTSPAPSQLAAKDPPQTAS